MDFYLGCIHPIQYYTMQKYLELMFLEIAILEFEARVSGYP